MLFNFISTKSLLNCTNNQFLLSLHSINRPVTIYWSPLFPFQKHSKEKLKICTIVKLFVVVIKNSMPNESYEKTWGKNNQIMKNCFFELHFTVLYTFIQNCL